jgi:hypothetical protein
LRDQRAKPDRSFIFAVTHDLVVFYLYISYHLWRTPCVRYCYCCFRQTSTDFCPPSPTATLQPLARTAAVYINSTAPGSSTLFHLLQPLLSFLTIHSANIFLPVSLSIQHTPVQSCDPESVALDINSVPLHLPAACLLQYPPLPYPYKATTSPSSELLQLNASPRLYLDNVVQGLSPSFLALFAPSHYISIPLHSQHCLQPC